MISKLNNFHLLCCRRGLAPRLNCQKIFNASLRPKRFARAPKNDIFRKIFLQNFKVRAILSSGLKVVSYSSPSFDEREVAAKAEKKLASFSSVDFLLSNLSTDLSIYYWLLAAKFNFQ